MWGFSTENLCFLEAHDTRSGDVASGVLLHSKCEVLVSDVYSGYGKAIRVINEVSKKKIRNANCNSHARRYFFKAWKMGYKEAEYFLDQYHEIYQLESLTRGRSPPEILESRGKMKLLFDSMRDRALEEWPKYPEKNIYAKGLRYFLENYVGLTLFLSDASVPIDNNLQERLLRNHVVGRKTWYGTHSERGAETAAILFSLVETCKMNGINPRAYLANLTEDLLNGVKPYTTAQFKLSSNA